MSAFSVLRTKLYPPRLQPHTLVRPRVDDLLRQALDHPVTLVLASTGYGKSTALASLAGTEVPLVWYSASEGDADPPQFLSHLITAFHLALPHIPETPMALLQEAYPDAAQAATDALLNALNDSLSAPTLLVVDDYHLAEERGVSDPAEDRETSSLSEKRGGSALVVNGEGSPAPERGRPPADAPRTIDGLMDHFLAFLPRDLHVIISTRYPPHWEHLVSWRARGHLLEIRRDALAFTHEEVDRLFRETYGLALSEQAVGRLAEKTEGWPIALQLVWQELRARPDADIDLVLGPQSGSHETLFAYLAQNVLAQQPAALQDFLLQTSVLRELDPAACRAVTHGDSSALLAQARARDLFLVTVGEDHDRYHHLFHDFLRDEAARRDPAAVHERHLRAADYYRGTGNAEESIYHSLRAGAAEAAAQRIEEIGETVLRSGRLDTLAAWMDALPPDLIAAHPLLMFYLGDLARLRSRFDDALAWYAQAERACRAVNDIAGISRALRGQALVYLDTVRPSRAEDLLQEALRLNDGLDDRAARARLLELLAENKLNMGKAEQAEALRVQARTLREEGPSEDVLSVRVWLRTGRLDEARSLLETWAREERGQLHPPRAHRETLLVLSLVYSMQGCAEQACRTAQEGIALAAELHSPFVSAVGQMRLGHALQIRGDGRAALHCYEQAMALGDQLAVRRTRAEARWGMTRAHGLAGDLEAARRDAAEGVEIGRAAGDAWIVALVQLALGASTVLSGQDRAAVEPLNEALAAFRSCGDRFGRAAARLWLALAHWHLNQVDRALTHFDEALALAQAHGYDYLLTQRTLLGWQDARVVAPLLLEVRKSQTARSPAGRHAAYAAHLLAAMGLERVTVHPGYQLRVQTLGAFRVWRGEEEVSAREWHRRKARELLALFITFRGKLLEREEIFELLWREESPESAARDFKVALNALHRALEPDRLSSSTRRRSEEMPAFIAREDSAYGLRRGADLRIDAEDFARLVDAADRAQGAAALDLYRQALALYHDNYLSADARYADWATAERERLLALNLRATDRLAAELLARGEIDECIAWCERLLERDRCWEHAYRLMMQAFARRGDRAQARQVMERCLQILRTDLDVDPSPATVEVFQSIRAGDRGQAP